MNYELPNITAFTDIDTLWLNIKQVACVLFQTYKIMFFKCRHETTFVGLCLVWRPRLGITLL